MIVAKLPFKITRFIAGEASGSDISNPNVDSGYSPQLVGELHRVGSGGGTVYLTALSLEDLAEWLDAMTIGNSEGGGLDGGPNYAGARSCARTAEKARTYASRLREQDTTNTTKKEATMAKVTRSKSAKAEKTTTTKKSTTKAASNGRRTAADWDSIVEEIRAKRQGGSTMQALKKEYGVSSDVPLREALARAGYNSKGDELEYEDISGLTGAKLKNRLVKERSEGTAWYMLALMTGKPEPELREIVGDAAPSGGGRKAATKTAESAADKPEGAQTKTTTKKSGGSKVKRGAKANPSQTG
jgi:hypothetical protein